ncbi:FIST C-terminal domain-containing protein [bacterium]|nr:FIST C-terminal domain-containing protein [bacterium]
MFQAGAGQSLRTDGGGAIHEAIEEARRGLGNSHATAAFVFATSHHLAALPGMAQTIQRQVQPRAVFGATGTGVIGPRGEIERVPGVSVLLLSSDRAAASAAIIPQPESFDSVDHLQVELPSLHRESGLLMLAVNPRNLHPGFIQRLAERLPETPVIGGAAGWCTADQVSGVIADSDVSSGGCAALHLSGCVEPVIGVAHSIVPDTKPLPITESAGNAIVSIAAKPAADVFVSYVQAVRDQTAGKPTQDLFCLLGERAEDFTAGRYRVRNILAVEPATKNLVIGEPVEPGGLICFGLRSAAKSRRSFRDTLEKMSRDLTARIPRAAVLFNCCARGRALHSKPHVDLDAFREFFPDLPIAGFFGFSEIGPVFRDGKKYSSAILAHTAVLAILTEPLEMLGTT